jgi:CHRD domain
MKLLFRAALVVLTLFSVAGAKDNKSPFLHAKLIGFQEVPVVSTVATGEFRGVINPGDQSINFTLTYSGLQGAVTQAHIHLAQRSVNGGIVIWFCKTTQADAPAGTPTCTNGSGSFSGTITAANVVAIGGANVSQQVGAGELAKVIAAIRAGKAYANVHTNLSTGGEIRGQIEVVRRENDDGDDDEDED